MNEIIITRRRDLAGSFSELVARERDLLFKLDLMVSELRALHPLDGWEIWALDVAAQEGIQLDFLDRPGGLPSEVAANLRHLLSQRYGMDVPLARWVVEAFGQAFHVSVTWDADEGDRRPSPPLAPAAAETSVETGVWRACPGPMVALEPMVGHVGTEAPGPAPDDPVRRQLAAPDATRHPVSLSYRWAIGVTTVTQAQWRSVDGEDPPGLTFPGDSLPAHGVNWDEVVAWCNRLSILEGLEPAYLISEGRVSWPDPMANGYRLPTEHEWELACRAGGDSAYATGDQLGADQANYDHQWGRSDGGLSFRGGPLPVGTFPPNDWGLYDMHGNVCEWCWGGAQGYATAGVSDPVPLADGPWRPARGGSWALWRPELCASSYRFFVPREMRGFDIGFRLARTLGD